MQPWIAAPVSLLCLVLAVYCHRHWLAILPEDPPSQGRRHHLLPMPMTGFVPGLVILAGLVGFGESPFLIGAVALATLTGYLDDRGKSRGREMSWRTKGALLLVAGAAVCRSAAEHTELTAGAWLLALLWVFAVTNATNFMDNTDGVAPALGALGLLLASGGEGAMAFAGFAALGFLPGNWPRPSVFLGDSGSLCLGTCLGWATLQIGLAGDGLGTTTWPITAACVMPIAMFALDFAQVIVARLILGVPPWVGDRRHLTHISMNFGLPRVLVAPTFAGLGAALFLLGRY